MHKKGGKVLYSASDMMAFIECQHLVTLNLINLETPLTRAETNEKTALIQDKGFAHEAGYLSQLRSSGLDIVELSAEGNPSDNIAATLAAMKSGVEMIFQAALTDGIFFGYADFLRRVDKPSKLGDWSYEVIDTKLAHRPKPKFMIQLAHYSVLLSSIQGVPPVFAYLVFGNKKEMRFRLSDYVYYYRRLRERFDVFLAQRPSTSPESCNHCSLCDWRDICTAEWRKTDHLNQVANISKIQIRRLKKSGVSTLAELATIPQGESVPNIQEEVLVRLRSQATLQLRKRESGENQLEVLQRSAYQTHGFDLLPAPDTGDLYFDMEGDPLYEEGLEYLFGVYFLTDGKWLFKDFWAHDRLEEKQAFSAFMGFVTDHLKRHPTAHIYHYAPYEPTALKRLMSLHGVREAEVDDLLRGARFIDLYAVVRQSVRVSEPKYSIKNLETFYMAKRQGEVTDAGASVVYYEKWRETRNDDLLRKIRDYNKDDCISTQLLHQWLLGLKEKSDIGAAHLAFDNEAFVKSDKIAELERRLETYREVLLAGVSETPEDQNADQRLNLLIFQLLDFYRRAAKPGWWQLFARRDSTLDELIDDSECIAGLTLQSISSSTKGKGIGVGRYSYPEQEFKLREGAGCLRTDTSARLGTIEEINESDRTIDIKFGRKIEMAPDSVSISAGGPISTDKLREALFRFADDHITGGNKYSAATGFLRRLLPRIVGLREGEPIIADAPTTLPQIIDAIAKLDQSHIFVQGPPGAGKTFTGSHVIAELLYRGCKVGITSNSHKAIHNLLHAVEERASERGIAIRGAYKASSATKGSEFEGRYIENVQDNAEAFGIVSAAGGAVVAGTAWLFCDEEFDQVLDYLFVDEAGQVATANLIAMATSARNVVLLGDQMQLGQPIQGVHPGESGLSSLDFLLGGRATIPPEEGIFLATTWRMHPDLCQFISDAIYESRLYPEAKNCKQRLILKTADHPAIRPTGLSYVPVIHEACSQSSAEEADVVKSLFANLLQQQYEDRDGGIHDMGIENILVVAPFNVQVNLLKRVLPDGARVGTVDKFQGQEAEVVIVSMTTSDANSMPRHIEFLYSKNRLNVAVSRARCLAILVASPALAVIPCATVEQMALVNLMCGAMKFVTH